MIKICIYFKRTKFCNNDLDKSSVFGLSGYAMLLGKLPVAGRPANLCYSRARSPAFAVGADGGCFDIFSLIYHFSPFCPSLRDDLI